MLRWHGGKYLIADWVISHFPRHHLYAEPYGGAFSVGLRKPRSLAEVWNDLDEILVQLFAVLRDPEQAPDLIRRLLLTPYHEAEFRLAYEKTDDPVEAARRTIARSFMGFGGDGTNGKYSTGFRSAVTSHLKLPAQEWASYPDALRLIVERVRGVTFLSRPALRIFEQFDAEATLFYVDPPYLPETRSKGNRRRGKGFHVYAHELEEADHVELLAVLQALKGMVVLSGYPSELYDDTLAGWERVTREAFADGGRPRTEVLYINHAASEARRSGRRPRAKTADGHGPLFKGEDDAGNLGRHGEGELRVRGECRAGHGEQGQHP